MAKLFANSGDPDQTPRYAASELDLQLFANYPLRSLQTTLGYALVTKIGRCPGIGGNREHTGGFCNFSDIGQHR